jgi:hypothetical protein
MLVCIFHYVFAIRNSFQCSPQEIETACVASRDHGFLGLYFDNDGTGEGLWRFTHCEVVSRGC